MKRKPKKKTPPAKPKPAARSRPAPKRKPSSTPKPQAAKSPPPSPATPAKGAHRSAAGWENERKRSAETQAEKSRAGRDIAADFPAVVNPERKAKQKASLEFFLRTYLPETFRLQWSPSHLEAIAVIEQAILRGGWFAYAMPRGSGKTSIVEGAALWAELNGYREFVVPIGSDEAGAIELLDSIKRELENNDLLLEDFPEVCYPIRRLEGIAHRANGQLFHGERTYIVWTAKEIVLPTIPGSPASGAIIRVAGITGRIRGMKFKRPDGRNVRPDFVIPDDPQTDESAKSPGQTAERERIIAGTILGLAGPGKKIAAVIPCTVIAPDDLADRLLDRRRHPEWQGKRTRMLVTLPKNEELWDQYAKLRAESLRAGNEGREATEFYRQNRKAMDEGAEASWPVRFNPDEVSAVQHGMNLKIANPDAFFAEYQNEPQRKKIEGKAELLTVEQICAKVGAHRRGEVPSDASRLVAFVDVQKDVLYWGVCAFEDDFTGCLVDFGTYPDQQRRYFRLSDVRRTLKEVLEAKSLEEALRLGLDRLAALLLERQWRKDDESTIKIERMLIDTGWAPSQDVIYQFCRESAHTAVVMPSKGVGVGATSRPFNDFKRKRGERRGLHWRTTLTTDRPFQRRMLTDTNHYKSFLHARLATGHGGHGAFTLFAADPDDHRMLAEHLVAEDPVEVTAKGQTVVEWKEKAGKPDNHGLDVVAGCCAAADERGCVLAEAAPPKAPPRKRVKLSELEKGGSGNWDK